MKKPPTPPARLPKGLSVPLTVAQNCEAKLEWLRIVGELGEKLDPRDRSLLEDYCMTTAEIIQLREIVDTEGRVLVGPKGGAYINPTVNLLISRQSHIAALRRDLYFTPKSRIEKQTRATMTKGRAIRAELEENDGSDD